MDILNKIKRLAVQRKVRFTNKAKEERRRDGISADEIIESLVSAPVINKTIKSTSEHKKSKNEKLYVIISPTYDGTLIYTKGTFRKHGDVEEYYLLISSKWSTSD